MTKNEFLIKIGISPDNVQNQKAIDAVLEQVRLALNKEFKLNISEGNVDQVLAHIEKLGSGIRIIKDESGNLTSVSTNFKSVNGSVVTLNTNIQTLTRSIREFKEAGGNLNQLGDAIKEGRVLDSSGNKINSYSDRGKSSSIIDSISASSTTVNKTNPKYVLDEIIKRYQTIQRMQSQINGSNWRNVTEDIKKARDELDKYILENKDIINPKELSSTQQRNEKNISSTSYNQILTLQNQIRDSKIKELAADKSGVAILEQKRKILEQQLLEIQKISKLSSSQQSGISQNQKSNNLLFNDISNIQKQSNLEQELTNNLNKQLSVIKQISNLDEDRNSNFLKLKKSELQQLELEHKNLRTIIEDKQTVKKIESQFQKQNLEISAQKNDANDVQKIQQAVNAKKELAKAETELFKLQQQKGSTVAINEARDNVTLLSEELKKATSQQISNGNSVKVSSQYQNQANKINEEASSIQRQLDARYKTSTISLGRMAQSIQNVAANVVQYNLAWGAFNKVDSAIVASVQKIKELDTAMTNVQLVTGQTNEQVRQTINEYADMAIQLGATTKQVAEGKQYALYKFF